MIELKGIKSSGFGAASHTLGKQLELIRNLYPEISDCYSGTLNIHLDSDFIIVNPDYRTGEIQWAPGCLSEIFDFLKVELFIPRLNRSYIAWIYVAYNSPHRSRLNFHEVICEKINDLHDNECLILKVNKTPLLSPYLAKNIYVV